MKLLIRDNMIIGTALDSYADNEITESVSDDFDINDTTKYKIENNQLVILNNTEHLAALKQTKKQQIQLKKNEMRDAGFFVDDIKFDSDIASRLAYTELGLQLQSSPDFVTMWKASDGVWVTMNSVLYQQVIAAGKTHIESCFAWQATKEIEINTASTIEELESIEI